MSNFYTVRLRRFSNDTGFTGLERDLFNLNQRAVANVPLENREQALNDLSNDNRLISFAEEVIFDVSPTISENRSVDYDNAGLPAPQGIVVYRVTNNRTWSISARFVSRNLLEADTTWFYINRLRSWTIPKSTKDEGVESGRPPVLRLNGYKNQFSNIPVVISSLFINFPEDVDYIEGSRGMVPIIQTVEIELIESHRVSVVLLAQSEVSDAELPEQEFNLALFKIGQLPGY